MKTIIKLAILLLPFLSISQQFENSQYIYEREIEMYEEGNDCSVRAIAVAYNQTYYNSMQTTYTIGRKRNNGMILSSFVKYLSRTIINNKRIASMETLTTPLSVREIKGMTKYRDKNLFLVTKDHIFNYKDNVIYGNSNDYRIKDVILILEIKPFSL